MTDVVISGDLLRSARITPEELLREIAVILFSQRRFTLAQGAELAKMSRMSFQQLLASRQIPIHYDIEDIHDDLEANRRLFQS